MIEVEGLRVAVGGRALLRGVSLQVAPGEVGLLTGPSGSGKSSLLRILLGLHPRAPAVQVQGRAHVAGLDALATPTPVLARRAALLFQDPAMQLSQSDVAAELAFRPENLGLPWRDVEARVEAAVRRFGLEALRDRPVASLSGGERKRAALAALLAAEPEVLLLDEPLGGLDADWRARILKDLRREARGRAMLVVEHRTEALAALRPRRWALGTPEAAPRTRGPSPAKRGRSPWPPVLVEGVSVSLGGRTVLDDVSFEASSGVTLLMGPNGSGKTTVLRALLGLQRAEGRLRVAGIDPQREPLHRIARAVGYVPQRAEDMFTEASVRAELALGPRLLGAQADESLAAALGLTPLLDRHPLTLSGGEQQRLALACALAHRPRVLLLDEPTVGLDARGLGQVLATVRAARRDLAVVIATHDPELLALADEVAVLGRGRIAYQGPPLRAPARRLAA